MCIQSYVSHCTAFVSNCLRKQLFGGRSGKEREKATLEDFAAFFLVDVACVHVQYLWREKVRFGNLCVCGCFNERHALYHPFVKACDAFDLLVSSDFALRKEEACCGNCARGRAVGDLRKAIEGEERREGRYNKRLKRGSSPKCSFFALPIELASVFVCFSIVLLYYRR